jgi:DNA-directed RNA polymerase specialized sigma subunit, sigma24 homolog
MTQSYTTRPASSNSNQVVFDDQFINNVKNTVNYVLRKNAGSWISSDDIEMITSDAYTRIWEQVGKYDPAKGASFKTWYETVARRYAISAAKKLKNNDVDKRVRMDCLTGFDNGHTEDDPEKRSRSKKINYMSDTTFGWAAQELGINLDEFAADYSFTKESDENASLKRLAKLEEFLKTRLTDREKFMLGIQDGEDGLSVNLKSKEQLMEELHMSGSNADTSKHRLLSKIYSFISSSEYNNEED